MLHQIILIRAVTVVTPPDLAPLWSEYRKTSRRLPATWLDEAARGQHAVGEA